jgi:hypothetical protein
MKYIAERTVGIYKRGHVYDIERPIPVLAASAIRAGMLVPLQAAGGWCAPSETAYGILGELGTETVLPAVQVPRGGIKFDTNTNETKKKPRKRTKPAEPDTLESLAEKTAEGLDDLRGPTAV